MNRYKVNAVVQGNTENEVAAKLMVAAYVQEFEVEELDVELIAAEVRFLAEDVPEDNDSSQPFHFPHITELINGLQKKAKDANDS
jgi:hypothetical protein